MIDSVNGKIFKKEPTMVYVDTGSIVLSIHICLRDYEKIPNVGESISINTYLNVKENLLELYGFIDEERRGLFKNLFGYGHGNFGIVRNEIKPISEFSDSVRPTGPHNSFIFLLLDYGVVGFLIFLFIFITPFMYFLKNLKLNIIDPDYLFIGAFVGLSLTGDFIQNHSISVLFFLIFLL